MTAIAVCKACLVGIPVALIAAKYATELGRFAFTTGVGAVAIAVFRAGRFLSATSIATSLSLITGVFASKPFQTKVSRIDL